jgi:hypothetical protein
MLSSHLGDVIERICDAPSGGVVHSDGSACKRRVVTSASSTVPSARAARTSASSSPSASHEATTGRQELPLDARSRHSKALDACFQRTREPDEWLVGHTHEEGTYRPSRDLVPEPQAECTLRLQAHHITQVTMDVLVGIGPGTLPCGPPCGDTLQALDDALDRILRFGVPRGHEVSVVVSSSD